MKSIEKNDVDISKLFNWGGKLDVVDSYQDLVTSVYIRLVGDTDLNKARVYGLRRSAELRKLLRTEGTDENLAYIPDLDNTPLDNLVEIIITQESRNLVTEVMKDVNVPTPPEPDSEATLEQQEEYQRLVDSWPQERQKKIEDTLMNRIDQEKARLKETPRNELEELYKTYLINNLCEDEMYSRYLEMCAYYGTFLDSEYRTRLFSSFEQFANLPLAIKNQFVDFYSNLDIKIDDLKK